MTSKEEWDKFAADAIEKLKIMGYLEKTNRPVFMIAFAIIIAGMIAGSCFLYGINRDAFQSSINQTQFCPQSPDCNCPDIIIPKCPEQTFTCNTTCNYPNNLSIKLVNATT